MKTNQKTGAVDIFRIVAAFLIIAIHTSPFYDISPFADMIFTRTIARVAVPFFFMATGYFALNKNIFKKGSNNFKRYISKLAVIYAAASVLYIPANIYAGHYEKLNFYSPFKAILFDGTFYHLWYLPAVIIGSLIVFFLLKKCSLKFSVVICAALYIIGLSMDSYYGFFSFKEGIFSVFSYSRNGLFFAPIFLIMGVIIARRKSVGSLFLNVSGLALSLGALVAEGLWLHEPNMTRHDSMYLSLLPCMFFLFQTLIAIKIKQIKILRPISMLVYIIHPMIIILIRGAAKPLGLTDLVVDNNLIHYLCVCFASFFIAALIAVIFSKKDKLYPKGRAWIELDYKALAHNIETMKSGLGEQCEIMPVVKANAYGHGDVLISKELQNQGINAFCVACISEGIHLRQNGIKGEILILGYTHPNDMKLLKKYHLSQSIVDFDYAEILNSQGFKIHTHLAIDTGMHRLGERFENTDKIMAVFKMKNLKIDGIFSHLCADNLPEEGFVDFTASQAAALEEIVDKIKKNNFKKPKAHLLASGGILNYPQLSGDWARAGIALYGVMGTKEEALWAKADLKPVLSLKAVISCVKDIRPGEKIGYDLSYTSKNYMRAATVCIGYADGLPRCLSQGKGSVLVKGIPCPIIGRICMDQAIIDVTQVPEAAAGDVAVIIGKSEESEISVYSIAQQAGTITNEILSCLGNRLDRIVT